MNSKRIIEIINNPGIITTEESEELKKLSAEYPYCQAFRILQAKESHDKHLPDEKDKLAIAALYTADRSNLQKYLVTRPKGDDIRQAVGKDLPNSEVKTQVKTKEDTTPSEKTATAIKSESQPGIKSAVTRKASPGSQKPIPQDEKTHGTAKTQANSKFIIKEPKTKEKTRDLADELIDNLEEYKRIHDKFISVEKKLEGEKGHIKKTATSIVSKRISPEVKKTSSTKGIKKEFEKKDIKKNEKRVEPENEVTDEDQALKNIENTAPPIKDKDVSIQTSAKISQKDGVAVEVENPQLIKDHIKRLDRQAAANFQKLKQQEQLELIDRFIETTPDLTSTKTESEQTKVDQEDLSIHSTQFGDDLVTENLANIMILQKNLDIAIDIYKKLIWKFPQKKGYFATQIEKLQEQINKGS